MTGVVGEKSAADRAADDEYRQWLVQAEQKAQDDYDKTVLTLSGGALAISFAFVKDIIGDKPIEQSWLLIGAWIAWAASTMVMLTSYYVSRLALRKAIEQCDDRSIEECETPGGIFTLILRKLNVAGAILFFGGVCLMAAFVNVNIAKREVPRVGQETTKPDASPATKSAPRSPEPQVGSRPRNEPTRPGPRVRAPAET